MGRTIASITQTWQQEEAAIKRFERALRKEDQNYLNELLVLSRLHLAEASYASNLYPLDMYLIAIALELYKQLKALQKQVNGGRDPQAELDTAAQERFLELLQSSLQPAALQAGSTGQVQHRPVPPPRRAPRVRPPAPSLLEPGRDPLSYANFEEAP